MLEVRLTHTRTINKVNYNTRDISKYLRDSFATNSNLFYFYIDRSNNTPLQALIFSYKDSYKKTLDRFDILSKSNDIPKSIVKGDNVKESSEEKNIFISYRSPQVAIARAIAEHLMSLGVPVWFNEYKILGEEWHSFEQELYNGLNYADRGIILSCPQYHESNWCKEEFNHFKKALSPTQILEIVVPPLTVNEEERPWVTKRYKNLTFQQLVDFIDSTWQVRGHDPWSTCPPFAVPESYWVQVPLANIALNLAGWQEVEVFATSSTEENSLFQKSFTHNIGSVGFKMHITINPSNGLKNRFNQGDNVDDREVFMQNLGNIQTYMKEMESYGCTYELLGNHLIFAAGLNHFAFTYGFSRLSAGIHYIILRKYVLTFPCPEQQGDMEVVVTCGIDSMPQYSLRDFAAFVRVFDRVVLSVRQA